MFIDYGGNPANHEKILQIANNFNIPVILDGAFNGTIFNGNSTISQNITYLQ